jgi:membrane associated rhomboid family serine protease
MIPIGDDNRGRRLAPVMTWLIIAANVFVFVFLQRFGHNLKFEGSWAAVPGELLTGRDIVTPDQSVVDPSTGNTVMLPGLGVSPAFVWLTILSSMFMHGSIGHIAGNMLFLGVFGDNVESRLGHFRFLLFYLLAGIFGALTHSLGAGIAALAGNGSALLEPMVGASGAISGVLGAYLMLFPGNRVYVLVFDFIPTALSAWFVIGLWFIMQIGGGLSGWTSSGVAYLAHVGGFVFGWLYARHLKKRERHYWSAWAA